jgi:hypothetical protein
MTADQLFLARFIGNLAVIDLPECNRWYQQSVALHREALTVSERWPFSSDWLY